MPWNFRHRFSLLALALAAVVALVLPGREARADSLSSCGDIFLDAANTDCKLETSGGCTVDCTPINFQLACSASLEVSCSGGCTADVDVDCTGSCEADCMGGCTADAGSIDCNADCTGRCEGDCTTECASDANQSECTTSCQASCNTRCSASCTAVPPSASCSATCTASCQGRCSASANLDCDVKCQESGYAKCEADLTGGCTAQCSAPMGALFCNGNYVNAVGDDLSSCVDQIEKDLNIQVSASGSASCSGDSCSAEGSVSVGGCSTSGGTTGGDDAMFAGVAVLGLVFARRRRRS